MSLSLPTHTLITFASYWGSKLGGINAFNSDLLIAMAAAYIGKVNVICIVTEAVEQDIQAAASKGVTLLPLPYAPQAAHMGEKHADSAIQALKSCNIPFDPNRTIWLGHDRITGQAALSAAQKTQSRSALIHHMSYEHYENFAENSQVADQKVTEQETLFGQADLRLAVGPLLRDALEDLTGEDVDMLIPGLANIDPRLKAPNSVSMFLSGRLTPDATKIKQGQLAIAAMANAYKLAKKNNQPKALLKKPKITLRGVSFEAEKGDTEELDISASELSLNQFAEKYAEAQLTIKALPYTENRTDLFNQLNRASIAAMPSWHEGFGLVGWEAIAAGVPLILSKESGLYEFLKLKLKSIDLDDVWALNINGSSSEPYFNAEDLDNITEAINDISEDLSKAKDKALRLRDNLMGYTWTACAESLAKFFDWPLIKGQLSEPNQPSNELPLPLSNKQIEVESVEIDGLAITKPNWNTNMGMAPSVLLRANEAVVPFDSNRQRELDQLFTWAKATEFPINIRLITGEGGAGKTRLGLELCKQLQTQGWLTGFLQKEPTTKLTNIWQQIQQQHKECLLVIDYAETRTDELLQLIALCQQNNATKTCILLLARDGGEWWNDLPYKNATLEPILAGSATTGPFVLPALYPDTAHRERAYQQALTKLAATLNLSPPAITPELTSDHYSKPLYIQMSALLSLHGEAPNSADAITKGILNHEKRYWQAVTDSLHISSNSAKTLLALVTLAGNIATTKDAKKYWNQLNDDELSKSEFSQLFNGLIPLYPGYHGLQAVKPDLLGEELVAELLLTPIAPALLDAVLSKSATEHCRKNALILLARLSIKKPAVNEIITQALIEHLAINVKAIVEISVTIASKLPELTVNALHQLSNNAQHSVATQLSMLIQHHSLALNMLVCSADQILFEKQLYKYNLTVKKKKNYLSDTEELARLALNLSISLSYIGNYELAAEKGKKALGIRQQLAEQNPDKYQPDYASSLNNYANRLSAIGDNKQAAEKSKQALEIYQQLTKKNPDKYQSNYAMSLSSHANHLSDLGDSYQGGEKTKQALEIYQQLTEKNTDKYQSDYALLLNNYASHLTDIGDNKQAAEKSKQALEIYQQLSEKNPDKYQPNYTMSLSNYASQLSDLGDSKQAVEKSKQALEVRQQLAEQNPDKYQPDYARSLNNYASHLREIGDNKLAAEKAKKALDIFQQLAEKNSDKYQPDYALSLDNYASHLGDLGDNKLAAEKAKQALGIRQQLAEKNSDKYQPDYALSLNNYASHLSGLGDNKLAAEKVKQALGIRHQLAEKNPDKYQPDYAGSLYNYASCLNNIGDYEQALSQLQLCKPIWLANFQNLPNRYAESLAYVEIELQISHWLLDKACVVNKGDFEQYLENITQYKKPSINTQLYFVEGLTAITSSRHTQVNNAFTQVVQNYEKLNIAQKNNLTGYWHCTCVWLFHHEASLILGDLTKQQWLVQWQKFKEQRSDNIPQWMNTFATKTGVVWP